ncbi:hypothetical protein ACWERF_28350 [Streptomyces griseoluteus]
MRAVRTGTLIEGITDNGGPVVTRVLTVARHWDHAHSVLAYVADHSPLPGPHARLLTLMLTLRRPTPQDISVPAARPSTCPVSPHGFQSILVSCGAWSTT